jgi:tetratricopeptide (TPR) repeat protein
MGRLAGRDEFAETRRCEALARLGLHAEVLEAAVRALPAASECAGDLAYYAGVAAANLARYEEAADYLARARSSIPFDEPAKRYLAHLRKRTSPSTLGGDWPYFSMQHWLPPGLFERIKADGGPNRYPGLVEALVCAINETGGRDPDPLTVLKTIGSPEARAVLERIASGTFGTDRVRIHAHRMLVELGERRGDLPATLWLQGEWKTLVVTVHEITEEAPSTLPAELQDRMHEAIEASRRKDWLRAEQIGRELRSKAPDHPQVCFNLAVALNAQDKLPEEVEALLLHAMRVDPSYPAAPSTLAMIRIRQDRLPEAKELLDRVKLPSKLHPTVYAIFLMAKAQVAVADGDFAAAAGTWEWLERISPESPMVREARDTWGGRLLRLMAPLRRRRARCREQQRRRLLSADPPLSECLEPLTREVLQETARAMNLPLPARLRKAELIAGIIRRLGDRRTVGVFRDSVGEPARTALDRVVAAGGVMPFAEFTRQWGAEEDGPPGWEWKEPGNVLGRLKFLGLLAEGTVGGRESVVVPREVREALRPQTA